MTRHYFALLLFAIARAFLAHGCGELMRSILARVAPGLPPLFALAVGLVLGVVLVDVATVLRHREKKRGV
jgi:hypothetical protein